MFKFRLDSDETFLILAPRWAELGTAWQVGLLAALFVVSPGASLQWAVVRINPASVVSDPTVKVFILSSGTTSQLGEVRFNNDSYAITTAGGVDYAQRL